MIVKHTAGLWLSNPAAALELDPDAPKAFFDRITLTADRNLKMEDHGWVKLGHAEVAMHVTLSHKDLQVGALDACRDALQKMDAEHERKRQVMLQAINKLSSIGWDGK